MTKRSKLTEKPVRMPDVTAAGKELAITRYIEAVKGDNTEAAKSQRFTLLLQALFGVQPGFIEDYVRGMENYLKVREKDRILRGRADQLSGHLIIEFETDLFSGRKRQEAEEQLQRYVACVWSQEAPRTRSTFVCLATDGRRFRAYAPRWKESAQPSPAPEDVVLHLLEDIDAGRLDWSSFYFFLDRYLLRAEVLKSMIEAGRDTIWAFVLKNIYKPLFLKERFDLVVGNPPWLSYRYVERSDYQAFLKKQITERYKLAQKRAELITHLELGTLFLARSADLYLKPGGRIGFVLPKSIFSADQHDTLRRGLLLPEPEGSRERHGASSDDSLRAFRLRPTALWDLEPVAPVFNISASVFFGEKTKSPGIPPIPGEILSGELPVRNAGLEKAEECLTCQTVAFHLSTMGKRSFWSAGRKVALTESPYRELFDQGATIVPRAFWFVDVKESELGFDKNLPPLVSSQRAQDKAKKAYQGSVIEGSVESRFIYETLLPVDMAPFGILRYRLVVVPVLMKDERLVLQTAESARQAGYVHLARWLDAVEGEWKRRRSAKLKDTTAIQWLDYRRKLTAQNALAAGRVIYATSGTHLCACVACWPRGGRCAPKPTGFVVDHTTYSLETGRQEEALYLAAILNASCVDSAIKATQAKGLWELVTFTRRSSTCRFRCSTRHRKSSCGWRRSASTARSGSGNGLQAAGRARRGASARCAGRSARC